MGSFLPALLFGVAFANIFKGIPFDQDGVYSGNLLTLLNPYGLLGGVLFLSLFLVHGALWLTLRADGDLAKRAESIAGKLWPVLTGVAVVFLVATYIFTPLYNNYLSTGPVPGAGHRRCRHRGHQVLSDAASLFQGLAGFGGHHCLLHLLRCYRAVSQPVSLQCRCGITACRPSTPRRVPLTLKIMLIVVLLFVPVVLAYQIWAYRLFSVKVTDDDLAHEDMY
jgi:cytochrome d ubiquinol oxidase subunit II